MSTRLTRFAIPAFAAAAIAVFAGPAAAQTAVPIVPQSTIPAARAVGSWWGRAIPSHTVCTKAQDPTCPVPNEIIMVFTIFSDRTFIGIDSNIFSGAGHSTAHGTWSPLPDGSLIARFTLLQSAPSGSLLGGFTNIFKASLSDDNSMTGTIDAFLYVYTNPDGSAVVGSDGLPTPNPLGAPSCVAPACQALGQFSFKAQRVTSPVQ